MEGLLQGREKKTGHLESAMQCGGKGLLLIVFPPHLNPLPPFRKGDKETGRKGEYILYRRSLLYGEERGRDTLIISPPHLSPLPPGERKRRGKKEMRGFFDRIMIMST